ncbi:FeoA family protein [Georgenia ruanii]|uniref:FeoA family protein n=1 Tax=Georgenia ruanii TaxID=348442 RepID=UPI001263EF55|nr:FeoA family protein [Georgenia ruanii]
MAAPDTAAPAASAHPLPEPAGTLADLAPGCRACVSDVVSASPAVARRLRDLGFLPGAVIEAVRRAPLGDPCVYRVCGYSLCLRREQARDVQVVAAP